MSPSFFIFSVLNIAAQLTDLGLEGKSAIGVSVADCIKQGSEMMEDATGNYYKGLTFYTDYSSSTKKLNVAIFGTDSDGNKIVSQYRENYASIIAPSCGKSYGIDISVILENTSITYFQKAQGHKAKRLFSTESVGEKPNSGGYAGNTEASSILKGMYTSLIIYRKEKGKFTSNIEDIGIDFAKTRYYDYEIKVSDDGKSFRVLAISKNDKADVKYIEYIPSGKDNGKLISVSSF